MSASSCLERSKGGNMTEHLIEKTDAGFLVHYTYGETELFPTEEEAKADVEETKRNDEMLEAGKALVEAAIKAHMEQFGIDRKTAKYWVRTGAEVTD
jgi:hypothetical protein